MWYLALIIALAPGVAASGDSIAGPDPDRVCEILAELDAQSTDGLPPQEALPIIEARAKFKEGQEVAPEEIKADAGLSVNGAVRTTDLLIAAWGRSTEGGRDHPLNGYR